MFIISLKRHFRFLGAFAFAAAIVFAGTAQAQSGPFSGLAGNWSGTGSIALNKGASRERLRCRAEYQVDNTGSTASIELRCASDSYKFELHGNVRYQNGQVQGDWSEKTRGAAGRVEGSINGDQISVRVDGQTFAALLSLTTKGDRQTISIKAPSGSQMTEANITLSRRG